jgi:hypothetical protein
MSEPPSLDLQVVEESPGEARCILPSRPPQLGRYLMGFGLLAVIVMGAFVLLVAPFPGDRAWISLVVLMPLVLFGLGLAGLGLWLAVGHVEIEIRRGTLRSVGRLGPLRWSRSLPWGRVRRFLVREMAGKAGRAAEPRYKVPADLAVLQAEVVEGEPVALALMYPRDLLQRLADELSRRCELVQPELPSPGHGEASPEQQAASEAAGQREKAAELPPAERQADDLPAVPAVSASAETATTLRYRLASGDEHPGCMLAYIFCFMLAWWAFVSFWGYGLVQAHLQGGQAWKNAPVGVKGWVWFQTIFFLPFAVAAVWLLGSFLRQVYRTLGHRQAVVEVSAQPLHPGEEFEVLVCQGGPLHLKRLGVLLVRQEEASYAEGTAVRTETRRAEEVEIVREEDLSIARGFPWQVRRTVRVPPRAMHSFEAKHNKVRWLVILSGDVTGWPSFEQHFPVVVHPAPGDGSGHE